jgi:transcriptional antiterminator
MGAAYDGSTVLPLDTRQARIARRLLDVASPTSVEALASELDLTPRVVRYNLPSVDAFVRAGGLRLTGVRRAIRAASSSDLEQRALASLRAGTAAEVRAAFA